MAPPLSGLRTSCRRAARSLTDFGFIPSTLGEDSDPLDVLVLMDGSVPVGCVLTVRLIGVIEAKQRKGDWIRNDRLLAVATPARTHEHLANLSMIRPIGVTHRMHMLAN